MSNKLSSVEGFTLIEALVAILIFIIALLALAGLQGWFAKYTGQKGYMLCMEQALENARKQCTAYQTPNENFICGGYTIAINVSSGSCSLPSEENSCEDITLTALYNTKTSNAVVRVCNFK